MVPIAVLMTFIAAIVMRDLRPWQQAAATFCLVIAGFAVTVVGVVPVLMETADEALNEPSADPGERVKFADRVEAAIDRRAHLGGIYKGLAIGAGAAFVQWLFGLLDRLLF
jgi:hypothetical protein